MKRLKLNSQGVAHHFLLALIVVGVAVGGSYYLIRSFADTCGASEPTSSAASDAVASDPTTEPNDCNAATEPVTDPVTAPATTTATPSPTYAAMCSITANTTNYTVGQAVQPTVIIRSTGTGVISPQISYVFRGPRSLTSTYTFSGTLSPNMTTSAALPSFALPTAGRYIMTVTSSVKNVPFSCSKTFTAISYTASCSISAPDKVKVNQQFHPVVTMRNTGTGKIQLRNITLITNPNVGATSYESKDFNLFLNPGQSNSRRFSDNIAKASRNRTPKSAVIKASVVADTSNHVVCSKTIKVTK